MSNDRRSDGWAWSMSKHRRSEAVRNRQCAIAMHLVFEERLAELLDWTRKPVLRWAAAERLLRDDLAALLGDEQMKLALEIFTRFHPKKGGRAPIKKPVPTP